MSLRQEGIEEIDELIAKPIFERNHCCVAELRLTCVDWRA